MKVVEHLLVVKLSSNHSRSENVLVDRNHGIGYGKLW